MSDAQRGSFHGRSALAGLALGALAVAALGMQSWVGPGPDPRVGGQSVTPMFDAQVGAPVMFFGPVSVHGIPRPDQMVMWHGGAVHTVPAGKLLVVTGLGSDNYIVTTGSGAALSFNGDQVLAVDLSSSGANGTTSIRPVPSGLTAVAGTSVTLTGGAPGLDVTMLGYLVDA